MACHEGHNGSAQMCHTLHCMLGNCKFERAYVFFLVCFEKQCLLVWFLVFFSGKVKVKDHYQLEKDQKQMTTNFSIKEIPKPIDFACRILLIFPFPKGDFGILQDGKKKKKTKILNYYNIGPGKLNDNNGAICMLQLLRCNLKPFCSN